MKKENWKQIFQIVLTILTALGTTLGVTSCMGYKLFFNHFKTKRTMATKGTLKYRKVTRTPQSGPNKNKQMYYATAVTDREMNFEEFVTHISEHNSPYSRGTVHGVLMDTLDCLQELILDGKSVRLSDLGLFSIGMTSRAEDTKDKVSAASVEGVHLILRNTKTWSNAELRKKCRIEEYDTYGNTTDEGSVPGDGKDNDGGGGTTAPDGGDGLE